VYVDGQRKGAFLAGDTTTDQFLYLGSGLSGANRFRGLFDHVEFWDQPVEDAVFAGLSNVAVSSLAGDYTRDGFVDVGDYVMWRKTSGAMVTPGTGAEGTGDGSIDGLDFALWQTNFGRTDSAGGGESSHDFLAATFSEPATATLPAPVVAEPDAMTVAVPQNAAFEAPANLFWQSERSQTASIRVRDAVFSQFGRHYHAEGTTTEVHNERMLLLTLASQTRDSNHQLATNQRDEAGIGAVASDRLSETSDAEAAVAWNQLGHNAVTHFLFKQRGMLF
jgi:hypothetical protein